MARRTRSRLPATVTAFAALAVAAACAPRPAPAPAFSTPAAFRVVAYNIRHGAGMDGAVDLERIADALRPLDADVVTLQEVDDRTERTGGVDQAAVLGGLLGMRASHGPHRPYQGGWYGNAVLTRLPVVEVTRHPIPPAGGGALAVHEVRVAAGPGGSPVSIVSVHLAGTPEERRAQAERLTALFGAADHPVVLAGDFNGRRHEGVMRALAARWTVLPKEGPPETYPADDPDREIDFVLLGGGSPLRAVEHRVVDEPMASDHRPILAVLAPGGGG